MLASAQPFQSLEKPNLEVPPFKAMTQQEKSWDL